MSVVNSGVRLFLGRNFRSVKPSILLIPLTLLGIPVHSAKPGDDATRSDLVVIETLQQIDLIHSMIEKYPHILSLACTADEVWEVFRSGRIASLIGIEGLHQIADSVSVLRTYHRLGVRYITLTHNCDNRYATSVSCNFGTPHRILSWPSILR